MEDNIQVIIEIREKFRKIYEKSPELYDDQDVERVLNNKFTVQRYLWHNSMDETKALQMLIESMKWRKEFGINGRTDTFYPKQFYTGSVVFPYCPDKNGFKTLFLRIKMIKRFPELKNDYKKFLVHNINKIDLEANGKGWVLVVDCSGAGISNCDIDLAYFLITTLNNNFPAAIQYILLHCFPMALMGVWKVAKTFIPSERMEMIRFSTSKDITDYIPTESLPDFLEGSAKLEYKTAPTDSPDILEFGRKVLGIPLDKMLKMVDSYEKFLKMHEN